MIESCFKPDSDQSTNITCFNLFHYLEYYMYFNNYFFNWLDSFGAKEDGDQWKRATKLSSGIDSADTQQTCKAKPGTAVNLINILA